MKKYQKIFSIISCICILTGGLAGCGSNEDVKQSESNDTSSEVVEKTEESKEVTENKEDITLRIFISNAELPDSQLINEELSKITQEKLGFDVEIVYGYDANKITLALASNEQMDLGFDDSSNFVARVRQGVYTDITDLLQTQTPELYNTIPEVLWKGSSVDGRNYAVPTYKEVAERWTVMVDRQVIEENNIDISQIKELKDVEPILEALKNYPDKSGFEILSNNQIHMKLALKYNYDDICDWFVIDKNNPEEIVHFMETEEYREFVYLMRDWYEKGYIAQDIATRTDYNAYHNSGNTGMFYSSYTPYGEKHFNDLYNGDFVVIPVSDTVVSRTSTMGSLWGIYSKSEHVEESLAFLELWNTDPEVKNMIVYGIEGKHYNLVDGKVRRIEEASSLHGIQNWKTGNNMIAYLLETEPDDKYEQYEIFNASAVESPALGFHPDTTEITSELAAITNVVNEYNPLLAVGAVEPDDYLDVMLDGIKSAGLDKVKAELQKQYDEWRNK